MFICIFYFIASLMLCLTGGLYVALLTLLFVGCLRVFVTCLMIV
jgi:hypothetical protein